MKKIFILTVFAFAILYTHAQNVGIGVLNPTRANLEVACIPGTTSAIFGTGAGISLQSNWPTIGFNQYRNTPTGYGRYINGGYAAVQYLDPGTGYMVIDMFDPGNVDELIPYVPRRALTISPLGNIGIATGTSNATLTVAKKTATGPTATFFGTTHHSIFNIGNEENTYIRAGQNGGSVIINDIPNGKTIMSGFVGINTATPAFPLEIRQAGSKGLLIVEPVSFHNWEFEVGLGASGYLFLSHDQSTSGIFESDGSYTSVSDRRLKKNIQPLPSLLDKVMQLKPSEYEMIKDSINHEKKIGFIAQEVNEYFPELVHVTTGTSNGYKDISNLHTLNYSGFGIVAIKAIQEQQAIIQKQAASIENMRSELDDLKKTINQLMNNNMSPL